MVGSAIVRALRALGATNILVRSSSELDLRCQQAVFEFFERERPEMVLLAAARVGGILANAQRPGDFLYDNLMISANVIRAAHLSGVRRLVYLGSSCIYPREAPQPMREEYLLTGPLEETNEGYSVAKIAGVKMCEVFNRQFGTDYVSVMPCNLYGDNDNYDDVESHVIPGMLQRMHKAKISGNREVVCWGTGTPLREFLFVDDVAQACVLLLERQVQGGIVNVGSGQEVTIRDLAVKIAHVVGFTGDIEFDPSKPDGVRRKLLDSSRMRQTGWTPKVSLDEGLRRAYRSYVSSLSRTGKDR